MGKTLVIVESPAKAKTIGKYLGREYIVKSSVGHIRDLPKGSGEKVPPPRGGKQAKKSPAEKRAQAQRALIRRMGVDPHNDWAADYQVLPDKVKILKELRDAAAKVDAILLATDLDREGEAIAWHLREAIGGDAARFQRVIFSEITKKAILKAFEEPGEINMDRVHAQQARRFLDRVVGFQVSPLLWKKVARGLSAGRVQSVATRLVVEREREIHAFVPEEYWEVHAQLEAESAGIPFRAEVTKRAGQALAIHRQAEADAVLAVLQSATYRCAEVQRKPVKQRPNPPFITSTLQQAASTRLGFAVRKTMTAAQRLYEAGLITYMRTDSLNLSPDALSACREHIASAYGQQYLPEEAQVFKSKAGAQEAHEAIRPTDVRVSAADLPKLDAEQRRLYDLIHRQFVACQMLPAIFDTTTFIIHAADFELRSRGRVMRFDGWLKVMPPAKRDEDAADLPPLESGDALRLLKLDPSQHFTKPPARFSEASLVKEMERLGIGRPSTYGAIISTIQDRGYVRVEGKRLYAEKTGEIVTSRLQESFTDLLDYHFTAGLEEELDKVAQGGEDWKAVLNRFYADFTKTLATADEEMRPNTPTATDIACKVCGRHMMVRTGQTGVFLGCSGYDLPPKERCTATMPLAPGEEAVAADTDDEDASAAGEVAALRAKRRCPLCGTAMDSYLVDETRKLHVCGNNPDCPGYEVEEGQFRLKGYDGPTLECDKCGSEMQLKNGRFGKYFGCTNPECKNTRKLLRSGQPAPPKADPVPMPELPCEKSDGHFVLRDGAAGLFLASSNYPRSKETRNPLVADLQRHRDQLDPKHHYLADAPAEDPAGNPAIIRFSRKENAQYVMSEVEGKPTGWQANYVDGHWLVQDPAVAKAKASSKAKTKAKTKAKAQTKG
ncbi:MAG: type I DNA topoisomerase [Planctomycetota bacterium]|nr:MAG: type I DNA topoisomerase [Planctomycetota bacterium]